VRGADFKRNAAKWRCPTGKCNPASRWVKAERRYPLIPRDSRHFRDLYASNRVISEHLDCKIGNSTCPDALWPRSLRAQEPHKLDHSARIEETDMSRARISRAGPGHWLITTDLLLSLQITGRQ
jgi:hypothetical protein